LRLILATIAAQAFAMIKSERDRSLSEQ
jgi:hypothetical protein